MKLSRRMTLATAIASSLAVTTGATSAIAQDAATGYVALGDSYSSGLGAGDYGDSGDCCAYAFELRLQSPLSP